jgi:hypothetical protein
VAPDKSGDSKACACTWKTLKFRNLEMMTARLWLASGPKRQQPFDIEADVIALRVPQLAQLSRIYKDSCTGRDTEKHAGTLRKPIRMKR